MPHARWGAVFLEPQFYLDEEAIRRANAATGMFNMVDTRKRDKVDFCLFTADAVDWLGSRRTVEDFEGVWLQVSRPEDAILMRGLLNQSYLDAWAARLDLTALLAELRSEAEPIE